MFSYSVLAIIVSCIGLECSIDNHTEFYVEVSVQNIV